MFKTPALSNCWFLGALYKYSYLLTLFFHLADNECWWDEFITHMHSTVYTVAWCLSIKKAERI